MKLTKYIMACILAFSLAGCIDDEPSNNPITYGDGYITVLLSTDKPPISRENRYNFL